MASKIDGVALATLATGTLFVYAGITGKSVLASIQSMISGKSPSLLANINPINGTGNPNAVGVSAGTVTGTGNGAALASDALKYVGHKYLYGGAPGTSGANPWDCSSFVNWVLGHDFKMTLPGGVNGYNGTSHGPTTGGYMSWSGAHTIPRSSLEAGDLCVWSTHIGIAINSTQMVSALNPSLGTMVTTPENGGPQGESLVCRRINSMG